MRKLINSTYLSLDGVIENPQLWPAFSGGGSEDGNRIQTALLDQCDVVLMGRRTYEAFAPVWAPQSGDAFADRMNAIRKLVASTTLTDPDWNNTEVISGNLAEHVRRLKDGTGGNIVQYGFGDVSRTLLDAGLFDELRLWIHPLTAGPSDPADLISRPGMERTFTLIDATVLGNGIIIASYQPGSGAVAN